MKNGIMTSINSKIINNLVIFVAEVFTGSPGKLVDLDDTIKGFDAICKGEYDHLPEAAFYMVGGIEEVIEKAEKLYTYTAVSLLCFRCENVIIFHCIPLTKGL